MQSRSLIIKNLCPGLAEIGKLKLGIKGRMITSSTGKQFAPPVKLDFILVTTLYRGPDGNYEINREVHQKYGEKPRSLPIRLLFDEIDLNFQCRYACFQGRSLWCSGDGETASRIGSNGQRDEVPCPCGKQLPEYTGQDKCKINSRLSVLIDGTERVGGVFCLRSTSYNTTVGILSSLALIKRITGGPLAGLPLELTLNPKTAITPDGKTMNIWVAGIEFKGSVEKLQQIGLDQAKRDALHYARIERIEQDARLLLAHDPMQFKEESDEVVDEFYPDQAAATVDVAKPEAIVEHKPEPAVIQPAQPDPHATQESEVPEPATHQSDPPPPAAAGGTRRRTKKFPVDPEKWSGQSELATCGITPDQIRSIQAHASDPIKKKIIQDFMRHNTHYDQLSFLKDTEADVLLTQVLADPETPPQQPREAPPSKDTSPDVMIECPRNGGDLLSVENYCKTLCRYRQDDGWCPLVPGDEIPVQGGLI